MGYKSSFTWIVFFVVLSPFIAYGLSQFIPAYDGFVVTSGSMEPEIYTGSLLFTRPVAAEDVRIGDTITFQKNGEHTTHRVIQRNVGDDGQISFVTRGIANEAPDPGSVTANELVGIKLFSLPIVGYILAWAGTKTGFALLILVPGGLIIILEVREVYKELKGVSEA